MIMFLVNINIKHIPNQHPEFYGLPTYHKPQPLYSHVYGEEQSKLFTDTIKLGEKIVIKYGNAQ